MNEHGITIWLNLPIAVLAERLMSEKAKRPLIAEIKEETPAMPPMGGGMPGMM